MYRESLTVSRDFGYRQDVDARPGGKTERLMALNDSAAYSGEISPWLMANFTKPGIS
jgi:hypothetical protein